MPALASMTVLQATFRQLLLSDSIMAQLGLALERGNILQYFDILFFIQTFCCLCFPTVAKFLLTVVEVGLVGRVPDLFHTYSTNTKQNRPREAGC